MHALSRRSLEGRNKDQGTAASARKLFGDEDSSRGGASKSLAKRKSTITVNGCIPRRTIALEPSLADHAVCT
jgi:hypothetical protein